MQLRKRFVMTWAKGRGVEAAEPMRTWPGIMCGVMSAGSELPMRIWCAVRVPGS